MRTLALLAFLVLGSAALVGCGATPKCGPGNCTGCCDAAGQCQGGNTNTACGTGGLLCGGCSVGQTCNLGLCASAGTGGGSSSGGGGGSTGGGGGTTGGGSGGGTGSSYETWCASYLLGSCDLAARCGFYSSASPCQNAGASASYCRATPAMRDGRTLLDSNIAASCLTQLNAGACDADLAACTSAFRGAGALNAACYGPYECATDLYCDTSSTCPGVCRAATPLGQTTTGAPCVAGSTLYGLLCVAPTPIGQSCVPTGGGTSDRTCVANAFCSSTKVCTARRTSGQSCTPGSYGECAGVFRWCNGGICGGLGSLGAACDSTRMCKVDLQCGSTNVCVAKGTVGTACSSYTQCQGDLYCELPPGTTTGTCQPTRTLGQSCTNSDFACSFFTGLYCTATSSTTSGVCALKKGTGASCQSWTECTSNICTNSLCAGCLDPTP